MTIPNINLNNTSGASNESPFSVIGGSGQNTNTLWIVAGLLIAAVITIVVLIKNK